MKITVAVVFLFLSMLGAAQNRPAGFGRVDRGVYAVEAATPETLAQQLTAPYSTELEKVRSIFRWITENIAYAARPRTSVNRSAQRYKPAVLDSALAQKSVDEIVAYTVLQNRTAVCNGYARLFKTLCAYAGIRAELVTGYARGSMGSSKFRSNHTWNAVYVDSTWHLVDATWASGFISFANEFVKQYDESYFFPNPKQFIYSHYPEDLKWSLVSDPPMLHEFYQAPFRLSAFIKYNINSYAPARGVVEAAVGDTLQFRIDLKKQPEFKMAPEPEADAMLLRGIPDWDFVKPEVTGDQVIYTYIVPSDQVAWVHLIYNDDVILRYRLFIKKEKS